MPRLTRSTEAAQTACTVSYTHLDVYKRQALISVTFDGEEEDEISLAALAAIRELLEPYDYYIDSAVGNSQADSLASEMGTILAAVSYTPLLTASSASRLSALAIRLRNSLAGSSHCIDNAPRTNTPSVHGWKPNFRIKA